MPPGDQKAVAATAIKRRTFDMSRTVNGAKNKAASPSPGGTVTRGNRLGRRRLQFITAEEVAGVKPSGALQGSVKDMGNREGDGGGGVGGVGAEVAGK